MQNLLLVGMNFYDYENAIMNKLKNLGFRVHYLYDRENFWLSHFPFFPQHIAERELSKYQLKALTRFRDISFDVVLVLVGRYIRSETLEELKKRNPNAKFILYLWDDVQRVQNFGEVSSLYDKILTFDPSDASKYGFYFLPLFYSELMLRPWENSEFMYDIYSAMYAHSDREKIAKQFASNRLLRCKIILLANGKNMLKHTISSPLSLVRDEDIIYKFRSHKISRDELCKDMLNSKSLLDIQYPSQIGLTMRTFDVLSVGRKLITTNTSIQYYDFYNPQNIAVINRENPVIPNGFLDSYYEPISNEIIRKYSLENWLKVVFDEKNEKYLVGNNPWGL